jgi:hypothetical protein
MKKFIDNNLIKGFKLNDNEPPKGNINVDISEGELLYLIGVWGPTRMIAKRNKGLTCITYAFINHKKIIKGATTKEIFDKLVKEIILEFGEPDNKRDFANCKDACEQQKILEGDENDEI